MAARKMTAAGRRWCSIKVEETWALALSFHDLRHPGVVEWKCKALVRRTG
jgi:hypothetical protein